MSKLLGLNRTIKKKTSGSESSKKRTQTKSEDDFVGGIKEDWIDRIRVPEDLKALNVKQALLCFIKLDEDNPRKLSVTRKDVKNGPKPDYLNFDTEKQEEYTEKLREFYQDQPGREKKVRDHFSIALFAAAMKSPENLINPVTVYADISGGLNLLAGERRLLAHELMGADKIYARVLKKPPSDSERLILQWSENNEREDLPLADRVGNVNRIIQNWENENRSAISVRTLMSYLGISREEADGYVKLYKVNDQKLNRSIEDGIVTSLSQAKQIAHFPEEERAKIIQEASEGKTYSVSSLKNIKRKVSGHINAKGNITKKIGSSVKEGTSKIVIDSDRDFEFVRKVLKVFFEHTGEPLDGCIDSYSVEDLIGIWRSLSEEEPKWKNTVTLNVPNTTAEEMEKYFEKNGIPRKSRSSWISKAILNLDESESKMDLILHTIPPRKERVMRRFVLDDKAIDALKRMEEEVKKSGPSGPSVTARIVIASITELMMKDI